MIVQTILNLLNQVRNNQRGVTTVEYAVMLVLVAIAVAVFGTGIADSVTGVFNALVGVLTVPG